MIKWLLNTQDAAHVGLPGVRVIPVQAFRIEPVSPEDGFLSVDAESYNFKPVQGQILPNKAHLLSANWSCDIYEWAGVYILNPKEDANLLNSTSKYPL